MSSFPNQYSPVPAPLIPGGAVFNNVQTTAVTKAFGQYMVPSMAGPVDAAALASMGVPAVGQLLFITTAGFAPFTVADSFYVYKAAGWTVIV